MSAKLDEVNTTCVSGWIRHATRVGRRREFDPPAYAGGTDLVATTADTEKAGQFSLKPLLRSVLGGYFW